MSPRDVTPTGVRCCARPQHVVQASKPTSPSTVPDPRNASIWTHDSRSGFGRFQMVLTGPRCVIMVTSGCHPRMSLLTRSRCCVSDLKHVDRGTSPSESGVQNRGFRWLCLVHIGTVFGGSVQHVHVHRPEDCAHVRAVEVSLRWCHSDRTRRATSTPTITYHHSLTY